VAPGDGARKLVLPLPSAIRAAGAATSPLCPVEAIVVAAKWRWSVGYARHTHGAAREPTAVPAAGIVLFVSPARYTEFPPSIDDSARCIARLPADIGGVNQVLCARDICSTRTTNASMVLDIGSRTVRMEGQLPPGINQAPRHCRYVCMYALPVAARRWVDIGSRLASNHN